MTSLSSSIPALPTLPPDADKWSAGRVLVIGGSRGMSGAVRLAGIGACASGAGLVTLAVPEPIRAECATARLREMTCGVRATHTGGLAYVASAALRAAAASADAVVIGPGAGRHPDTRDLLRHLVAVLPIPVVVDADALFAVAEDVSVLERAAGVRVLTPHRAEAARLLGTTPDSVAIRPADAAVDLVARGATIAVVKGPTTHVAAATRRTSVAEGSNLLATGGAGDILAGLLGGFLAAGMDPFDAAVAATAHHGAAATDLARSGGVFDEFPEALARRVAVARRSAP